MRPRAYLKLAKRYGELKDQARGNVSRSQFTTLEHSYLTLAQSCQMLRRSVRLQKALERRHMFRMVENSFKKTPGQKLAEPSEGVAAYRAQEAANHANMLRLRAERLAREAANPPEAKPVEAKPKVRKKIIRK